MQFLVISLVSALAWAKDTSLLEARGYREGKCYRETAKVSCANGACHLRLNPGRQAELSIPVSGKDFWIENKLASAEFRMVKKNGREEAEVLAFVPYPRSLASLKEEFEAVSGDARAVPCEL